MTLCTFPLVALSQLYDDSIDTFNIDELQLFVLLFADDTVLFSYSIDGIQKLLNNLCNYCNYCVIKVNTEKTVVMVCTTGTRNYPVELFYDGIELNVVNSFNYLGVTITPNGNFYNTESAFSPSI